MSTQLKGSRLGSVLDVEVSFYERERDALAAEYPGRYLLIHGDRLVGHFETFDEATAEGSRKFGTAPILVRLAGEGTPVFTTTTIF